MAAKKNTTKPEPASLEILPAAQFATHEAARAFVAGQDYHILMTLVSDAAKPSDEDPPTPALLNQAREAAFFLANDLAKIARLVAANPSAFVAPVTSRYWRFSRRAVWLAVLLASARSDKWTEPYASGMPKAVDAQLDAIESEEGEAWRAAARGEAA